ncbi:MAG TPA: carboxypeptidase-like regulatory domain-containing protein, partial [Terriglobia bacterium]
MNMLPIAIITALLQFQPGSIAGIVKTTAGDPVSKATITLKQDGQQAAASVLTGSDGSFLFPSIPAGRYRLEAKRTGYMDAAYGKHSRDGAGSAITVAPAANLKDLNLTMTAYGAISGRVTDADGEPAGAVSVEALRYSYSGGRSTLTQVKTISTNDRGEYRLFWLPPGRYYIRCGGSNDIFINTVEGAVAVHLALPDNSGVRQNVVPTYFPGTPDPQRASSMDLPPGADYGGVDFTLNPSIGRRVHVTVVDGNSGQSGPQRVAALTLVPRNAAAAMDVKRAAANANGDGQFTAVPPGSYTLIATGGSPQRGPNDVTRRTGASIPVDVGDQDVDVTVNLEPSVNLAGRLTIEGLPNGTRVDSHPIVSVLGQGARSTSQGFGDFADFQGNDAFDFVDLIEGDYSVLVEEIPQNQYLKSVRFGSTDVLSDGLHVDPRAGGTLDIVLAANGGTVTGTVTDAGRQPAANLSVTLIPDESRRNRDDLYKKVSTDAAGRFTVQGIAPGDYTVFAWDNLDPAN